MSEAPTKRLVLHIEVPDIWADDLDEAAEWHAGLADLTSAKGPPPTVTDADRLEAVLEWFHAEVGLALIATPQGDKSDEPEFLILREGTIVGAEARVIEEGRPGLWTLDKQETTP